MAKKFSVLNDQPARAVEANVKGRIAQNKAQNTITRDEVDQLSGLLDSMTRNQRNALDQLGTVLGGIGTAGVLGGG